MQHIFWLIPGKLAGRAGPNESPWDAGDLKRAGIRAVISVNDAMLVEPKAFEAHEIDYACVPFSRSAPPIPGDLEICLEALPRAFEFVRGAIDSGKAALIHCTSGKDRTGLLMAYFLMQTEGVSVDEAIRRVREVRPIALSAMGWDAFGRRVLRQLSPSRL